MTESRLERYRDLVLRWNRRVALVSRRTPEESLGRLIRHSVQGAGALPPGLKRLIDVGSGAGLPGIPIALLRPEIEVRLVERGANKCVFLREAVRTLDLDNAEVVEYSFETGMIAGERPVAVTALALGGYLELAGSVGAELQEGDGMLLFVRRRLAEEIAEELGGALISWERLSGRERTGVAWIKKGP
jgi:16S rRNA (guanine527-N7)-methyltransferase